MAKIKPILPQSYIDNNGVKVVHYRIKPGNSKKHVYINDEDNTYIYHCIIRLIAEIGEKQFIRNPAQDFTEKQLPKIETLTTIIHNLYEQNILELGYNINTGVKNKIPHEIKFIEV